MPSDPLATAPALQESIPTGTLTRSAVLLSAGTKVGINYLKYYGKKAVSGQTDRGDLDRDNAKDIYRAFSTMKGGPLKVAQMLSIDQNLLPPAYAAEFSQAQYSAPPLSYPLVLQTFRREFSKSPTEIFDHFTQEAVSGASIGQVHKATLKGHDYAVKVQYPGVADSLVNDLAMVKPLALQIMGLKEKDVEPYFLEVQERLLEETNYPLELKNSQELSRACGHLPNLRFPNYYPEFSGKRIITMDWIEGVTLDKFAASAAPTDLRNKIGQALWDFYHHQIHQLRLFHADPHPGNFLIKDDILWVIDFGCTKRLEEIFYRKNFRFLDPRLMEDETLLISALEDLGVLLPGDSPDLTQRLIKIIRPSIEILALPFRCETFDFGDPAFMKSIYLLGEQNSQNPTLKEAQGGRGSPHSVYVNRAYFGLYSLLARLKAQIRPNLPDWINPTG